MSLRWKKHAILSPPSPEDMARMTPEKLAELWEIYHSSIENSERDPYRYGFILPNWPEADELLAQFNEILVSGGNRCLDGSQELYDPIKCVYRRIDSIDDEFHVWAWDFINNRKTISRASKPFQKPIDSLYRVELSNHQSFSCSANHQVLTPTGWRSIQSLSLGGVVVLPQNKRNWFHSFYAKLREYSGYPLLSNSEYGLSAWREGALRLIQTTQDFLSDYQSCFRFYDERLLPSVRNAQYGLRLQDDAQGYNECASSGSDDLENKSRNNRLYSKFGPLSILCATLRCAAHFSAKLVQLRRTALKSRLSKTESRVSLGYNLKSIAAFFHLQSFELIRYVLSVFLDVVSWTLTMSGEARLVKVNRKRVGVVWDVSVEKYHNYFIGDVLHKNSGKTSWAAKCVVRAALENPGSAIFCFAQNADVSIRQQQSAIYDALPEELRQRVLNTEANVSYTRKNGFSKSSLILPEVRSHIIFKTYSQFLNNNTILEGAELGSREPTWINIGAWCDEYLIGPELLTTLRFRLATRNAKLIVTFTPIDGYTEVVRDYLEGAKTIKRKEAALLGNRLVPLVQHSKKRDAGIIYFHSDQNPFGGFDRIAEDLKHRPEEELLCRYYGVPTKSVSTKFPSFSLDVNVVKHEAVPRKNVTRYMVLDPAGRKNWFMCWIAVDPTQTYYIYREWPDVAVGDWAKWHQGKYIGGEGAKGLGYGIKDYVDLIMRYEEGEEIFERLIDPRLGAAKYQTQNGASSIIEELADAGLIFVPAPGLEIEDGLQAITTKMAYNRRSSVDAINRPHFYVSDRCQNIITALQEYTGEAGPEEAWKDPIDVVRYACIDGISYVDTNNYKTLRRAGGY